jgi:hypothetical protein
MLPPAYPRSEADLEAWHVYADWLLEARDPRGPLIALDLSLPSQPSSVARDRLRRAAQRLKRVHREIRNDADLAWCLGHVRTMRVRLDADPAAVARALADPTMQLLEEILLDIPVEQLISDESNEWRALLGALPASCRTVGVDVSESRSDAARLLDALPPWVTTVAVLRGRPELFVSDRLAEVDARCPLATVDQLGALLTALASTTSVRVRVASLPAAPDVHARIVVGRPGDALFVAARPPRVMTLPRLTLLAMQEEHGLLAIRTILGRALPERRTVMSLVAPGAIGYGMPEVNLTRAPDGRYRVRSRDYRGFLRLALNGTPLPSNAWMPLTDGDRLSVAGVDWTFRVEVA